MAAMNSVDQGKKPERKREKKLQQKEEEKKFKQEIAF